MIRLLINFSTLKGGGGQNVALNFLYAVDSCRLEGVKCYYLAAKDSEVHRYLKQDGTKHYIVAPRNPLLRILFEFFAGWYFLAKLKIDIVYSYFGYAWFPKRWPQITGSADSNLYFPEIDFWSDFSGVDRLKKRIIDYYRLSCVKRANAIVFENEALEERAKKLYGLKYTKTIKPSFYLSKNNMEYKIPDDCRSGVKRGLFLCGWQLNKNIMIIPKLANEIRKRDRSFNFILTAPHDESKEHRQFKELVRKDSVDDMVFIIGTVSKEKLKRLYEQIDYVFLLSKLESFSNNIVEAWYFEKPLVVADESWARSICRDAVIYVDRNSEEDIANKICAAIDSDDYRVEIINKGKDMLLQYPCIEDRIREEIDYVRQILQQL